MKDRLRSPVNWYGGKGAMVSRLMRLIPIGGSPYCEPFCGGASLFFAREPAPVEVLNDLDGDVVNLYRCLQNKETFEDLRHRINWTPYARGEFARAIEVLNGEHDGGLSVDRAWAFFVAKNQGFAGKSDSIGNWGRVFTSSSGMASTASRWIMRQSMLDAWRWRLMRVQIDNQCALKVVRYWDTDGAVFYLDPPYVLGTRVKGSRDVYAKEPDDKFHANLVDTLLGLKGAAVISGYDSPIYWPLETNGWERIEYKTACHAAGRIRASKLQGKGSALKHVARTEVVWRNRKAVELCGAC